MHLQMTHLAQSIDININLGALDLMTTITPSVGTYLEHSLVQLFVFLPPNHEGGGDQNIQMR